MMMMMMMMMTNVFLPFCFLLAMCFWWPDLDLGRTSVLTLLCLTYGTVDLVVVFGWMDGWMDVCVDVCTDVCKRTGVDDCVFLAKAHIGRQRKGGFRGRRRHCLLLYEDTVRIRIIKRDEIMGWREGIQGSQHHQGREREWEKVG